MASSKKGFEHLEIPLEEIILATNNFSKENLIGHGGFGKVYRGLLSHYHSEGKRLVAIKLLHDGYADFYKELRMLSCYRHDNIVSLLGFSRGEKEMILVYEFASRGSLDGHLKDVNLTWTQRLKICLDAAKGLSYLHDPRETYQRLIHCDIKSANILLDENFKAKVADFGLSKIAPANPQNSTLITGVSGTPGYLDPVYREGCILTKESDVYSFGVVLFEVLCGKLCVDYINRWKMVIHVPVWKKSYEEKRVNDIILQNLLQQMDPDSLETFADIAYKCLNSSREERPAMSLVVKKLEESLALQELHDLKLPKEHAEIVKAAVPPLNYRSLDELNVLLTKGFHVNEGKTRWLSVNKEKHIERIYIHACLNRDQIEATNVFRQPLLRHLSDDIDNSRFPKGQCYEYEHKFKARVRGEYLTPDISYTVNLFFRYEHQSASNVNSYHPLRYKIDGVDETKVFIIYPSTHMREDGWFVVPLYQFTSHHRTKDLQFEFEERATTLIVAGIEFQPYEEKVELQVFQEYQDILKDASQSLFYTSLDELKHILSKGVHLDRYKTWFSLNEKGQHCHMISMKDCLIPNEGSTPQYESHCLSRFPAGLYQTNDKGFKIHVKTKLLSSSIAYTMNLVFRSSYSGKQLYVDLKYRLREETTFTVYLANRVDEDWFHIRDRIYMAELYQFTSDESTVDLEVIFENSGTNINGVEGILFQPLEIVEDQVSKDDKVENIRTISDLETDTDTYWERNIPNDCEAILKLSTDRVIWTTKMELYTIFKKGFLIDNGQRWFAIDEHGKKCLMLSARETWVKDDKNAAFRSHGETRFDEVLEITGGKEFRVQGEFKHVVASPKTKYSVYLVYKLPHDQSTFEAPMFVLNKGELLDPNNGFVYLVSPPDTPVITQKFDKNSYNPRNRYKLNAFPRQRSDGWMEVKLWGFETFKTTATVSINLELMHRGKKDFSGLIIYGIELKPI